ncbi:MAG: glycosyltransferase family 39 protein [Patescibacteria group bacterium]|nr:glycosyltransferase family 39 protein [Patescibacteria group bacterium]MCL5431540.1 glycosyltransferase family 39 protein [Patescibacteria group bacterium]
MKKKTFAIIFALILLVGLGLRTWRLNDLPVGLHFDEAQAGYNAYLLGLTGKNIQGQFLPIYIDSWGDYRPALVAYASIIPVKLFGLSPFSTRLPIALTGVLLGVIAYVFCVKFFKNKIMGLLAMALVMVSPYGFITSRGTLEGIFDVVLSLAAVLLLVRFFETKHTRWLPAVYFLYLLAYFSYQTSRALTPFFWLATVGLCFWQFRPNKKLLLLVVLPLVAYVVFPWFYFFRTPVGLGRFDQVSVFTYPEVQHNLNTDIAEDGPNANPLVVRVFHNKVLAYAFDIGQRYVTFFSPNPMLFSMREPGRHYVENVGAITMVEFIGFLLAAAIFLNRRYPPLTYLPLALLFLAPLPAALTIEGFPNFSRIVFFVPLWQVVAAFGLVTFLKNKKLLVLPLILLAGWQFIAMLHAYFVHEPVHYWSIDTRSTEMKSLALFLKKERDENKNIILSQYDGGYIYYLFYNQINVFDVPVVKTRPYFTGRFSLDVIDFSKNDCVDPDDLMAKKYDVLVMRAGCFQPRFGREISQFKRSDGSLVLRAYDLTGSASQIYLDYFESVPNKQTINNIRGAMGFSLLP